MELQNGHIGRVRVLVVTVRLLGEQPARHAEVVEKVVNLGLGAVVYQHAGAAQPCGSAEPDSGVTRRCATHFRTGRRAQRYDAFRTGFAEQCVTEQGVLALQRSNRKAADNSELRAGELSQIAQAQEMPYQRTTCTTLATLDYEKFAQATGCEFVSIPGDEALDAGLDRAISLMAGNRPVIVDVRIDYSKKTQFTVGTVKTNIKRFDTRNKLRIIGRALWRKMKNR